MKSANWKIRNGWIQLLIGIIGIWLFIFILTPLLTSTGKTAEIMEYIQENNIDATPLFYTESEVAKEAVEEIRMNR